MLGSAFALIGSAIFALFSHELAALYLDTRRPDAAQVLAYAGPLIVIAGAFQLVDGVQALAAGMLRGLKDTTVPMILALVSYWPIGFVAAYVLPSMPASAASASGTASCSVSLPQAFPHLALLPDDPRAQGGSGLMHIA